MEEKIKAFIDEIRPAIQGHGGDVEFISLDGDTVTLKLLGACGTCPYALATLKDGIEAGLRDRVCPTLNVVRAEG
ncbi:MAG: NifU family protein [Kiritimatiellae bacterium]|nr:NifU family protein [Kiritimatiellia bacterium]